MQNFDGYWACQLVSKEPGDDFQADTLEALEAAIIAHYVDKSYGTCELMLPDIKAVIYYNEELEKRLEDVRAFEDKIHAGISGLYRDAQDWEAAKKDQAADYADSRW